MQELLVLEEADRQRGRAEASVGARTTVPFRWHRFRNDADEGRAQMQTLLVFPTAAERQETSGSTCDGVDSGVRAGRRIERGPINLLLVSDGCFVSPTPTRGIAY